jgi:hypothetical protein
MAQKKKMSKTARSSMPSSKKGFEFDPTSRRLIPLGRYEYAYVLTSAGKTVRAKVGSPAFTEALSTLVDQGPATVRAADLAESFAAGAGAHADAWLDAARFLRGELTDDSAADDAESAHTAPA